MKRFFTGVVALIAIAVVAYILFTIGMIVISIAVSVALIAGLMVWIASFFMLKKQGSSIFSSHSVSEDKTETTIIDVEYSEVRKKK